VERKRAVAPGDEAWLARVDAFVAAGIDLGSITAIGDGPTADYRRRQGADPDGLAAELCTPELRRSWVAAMYGPRLWASPGTFSDADIAFMTEPWGDEARLRVPSLVPNPES